MKLLFLMLLVSITIFSADIKIPVQGYLTDTNGIVLNGEQNIKFSLYNTDENGNAVWTNQDYISINVENGYFSYMLGTTDFIDSSLLENSAPLYLEVEINNEVLAPRIELGVEAKSVYAYKSETANNALNSEKLEGKTLNEVKTTVKSEVKTEIDNEKLNAILSRLDTLEAKVTTLESENTNLKSRVSTLESENTNLKSRVSTLETDLSSLTTLVNTLKTKLDLITITNSVDLDAINTKLSLISVMSNVNLSQMDSNISSNSTNISSNYHAIHDVNSIINTRLTSLEDKTTNMSIETIDGHKTVRFTAVNLQIVNGSGSTESRYKSGDNLTDYAGLGNLIIGYDEASTGTCSKNGYNNLVVGSKNCYSSYGGVVFGYRNLITGKYSTITGGQLNEVKKDYSSISGGNTIFIPSTSSKIWKAGTFSSE